MKLFLIFVGDWTTTVRAQDMASAVRKVSDMFIAFNKPFAGIEGHEIKDYIGP